MFDKLRAIIYGSNGITSQAQGDSQQITASQVLHGLTNISYGSSLATILLDNNSSIGALRYAPILAAERFICESIAALPLLTYQRVGEGKERATGHPVYSVLRNRWNAFQVPFVTKKVLLQRAIREGSGFAIIERNEAGQVANIIPLDNAYVKVIWDGQEKYYEYKSPQLSGRIANADMVHVLGFTTDGICGVPLLHYAENVIKVGLQLEAYTLGYFEKGSSKRGGFKVPPGTTPEQYAQCVTSWRETMEGAGNHHKAPVFPYGTDWIDMSASNVDSQLLELANAYVVKAAQVMRVKPFLIQHYLNGGTYSNLEAQNLDVVQECLQHWITPFEEELNQKLFLPGEQGEYFCEFLVDARLRGNIGDRYTAYKTGREGGWLSINDIRRAENMSAVDGGDDYLTTPPGAAPNGPAPNGPVPSDGPQQQDPQAEKPAIEGGNNGTGN